MKAPHETQKPRHRCKSSSMNWFANLPSGPSRVRELRWPPETPMDTGRSPDPITSLAANAESLVNEHSQWEMDGNAGCSVAFCCVFFVPQKSLLESNDHHDMVAGDDANLVKDEGVVMWWVPTWDGEKSRKKTWAPRNWHGSNWEFLSKWFSKWWPWKRHKQKQLRHCLFMHFSRRLGELSCSG